MTAVCVCTSFRPLYLLTSILTTSLPAPRLTLVGALLPKLLWPLAGLVHSRADSAGRAVREQHGDELHAGICGARDHTFTASADVDRIRTHGREWRLHVHLFLSLYRRLNSCFFLLS
jgi:hypothetical protein